MSKVTHNDKHLFFGGLNSGVGGKLLIALTTDEVQVSATGVTIDMSASTAGAVWTVTVGSSTDTYTTAAVTSTTASKALTLSTGTSTPATAITGGATGAITARSGDSVANHGGATGGASGAASFGSGNASSTLGTSGASGAVTVSSGTSEDAASGAVTIASGNAGGNSGSINLTVGTSGGTRGNINLSATDIAVTGNLKINDLAERGADAGITLASGSEIIGVPKTIKAATAYNLADVALFTVPAGETWLITDCWHQATTSWDGNGTAQIGVTADADGFLALANASLVTTYDESGGITGWPTGSRGLQFTNRGVLLAVATDGYTRHYRAVAGTTILWDVTVGTSTQGVGVCYLTYIRLP